MASVTRTSSFRSTASLPTPLLQESLLPIPLGLAVLFSPLLPLSLPSLPYFSLLPTHSQLWVSLGLFSSVPPQMDSQETGN